MSFICSVCQAKNRLKLNCPSGPKSILYLFQFGLIKVNLNHQLQHIQKRFGWTEEQTLKFPSKTGASRTALWSMIFFSGENPATSLRTGMMVEIGELSQTRPNYSDSWTMPICPGMMYIYIYIYICTFICVHATVKPTSWNLPNFPTHVVTTSHPLPPAIKHGNGQFKK